MISSQYFICLLWLGVNDAPTFWGSPNDWSNATACRTYMYMHVPEKFESFRAKFSVGTINIEAIFCANTLTFWTVRSAEYWRETAAGCFSRFTRELFEKEQRKQKHPLHCASPQRQVTLESQLKEKSELEKLSFDRWPLTGTVWATSKACLCTV